MGSRRDCLSGDQKTSLCAGACAAGGECCSLAPRSLPCLGANLAPLFSCHSWRQARLAGGAGSGSGELGPVPGKQDRACSMVARPATASVVRAGGQVLRR